jgi:glutathione S-transferase
MLKLYYAPQTRAGRPRWMLEEIGAPYELARLDMAKGDHKKPEYLKLNPNGAVPTLVDGDLVLFESAAIVQYLADKFPDKRLAPPVGTPARGRYYQWIHYAMSGLEPPLVTLFVHTVMRPEKDRIPALVEEAKVQLTAALNVLDQALTGRTTIVGDGFTAADVMIASTVGWARMMNFIGKEQPNVAAYLDRMMERPAFQRAVAD